MDEQELKKLIRNYALQNAIKHGGKANPGNIVGKLLGGYPELRKEAKALPQIIIPIANEVNTLTLEQQTEELQKNAPEFLETKTNEKREILKALKNVKEGKQVVMRFEPSPSGPLHLGHSYPLMLNVEYCKTYKGKMILRVADTNPGNIDPDAYELIKEDFSWLTSAYNIETDFVIQSDRMELYYTHALALVEKGHMYVCTCPAEEFQNFAKDKTNCPCRALPEQEQVKRWHSMFDQVNGYQQGEAVVRVKTDMAHKNPAMRDFPALRINEEEHPRTKKKYRVWPLMNFAVTIDDHDLGLTHVLRGKDHYDNTKRQEYIYKYLGWDTPEYLHIGRINFDGLKLSCSWTKQEILKGTFDGWDDIRLPFVGAMRRRGFHPSAFGKYALSVGVTMNDKSVDQHEFFKTINYLNKEEIDKTSSRLFFIKNPKEITIKNAPQQDIELDLHPDFQKGGRKFSVKDTFLISEDDYDNIKEGDMVRLMDCLNFEKKGDEFLFHSLEYDVCKEKKGTIIHWLPNNKENNKDEKDNQENIPVTIRLLDNTVIQGVAEKTTTTLKTNETIQFERFGFVRLDSKENNQYTFWFTSK